MEGQAVRLELHAALVSQRRLEMWGSRGTVRGSGRYWLTDGENRCPQDPPLRTTLTILLAAQPFKDQVVLVTFKVLQSLQKKQCGLKRDEGRVLDSDLPVNVASQSLEHFISPPRTGEPQHTWMTTAIRSPSHLSSSQE